MEKTNYSRFTAFKITIKELLEGTYIEGNEQESNYLLIAEQKITRCNLMATVLGKEIIGSMINLILDDGTGKIIVRSFEENKIMSEIQIGDSLLLIGRIRRYNQEKYISPEIIKKIDLLWLKMRALENHNFSQQSFPKIESEEIKSIETKPEKLMEEELIEEQEEKESLPFQKLIKLIQELDYGEGVSIEEIIERSSLNETEELLQKMLERGDIYQIKPGKVKVL